MKDVSTTLEWGSAYIRRRIRRVLHTGVEGTGAPLVHSSDRSVVDRRRCCRSSQDRAHPIPGVRTTVASPPCRSIRPRHTDEPIPEPPAGTYDYRHTDSRHRDLQGCSERYG